MRTRVQSVFRLYAFLLAAVSHHPRIVLASVFTIGLLVRIPFAPVDFHVSEDLDIYRRWALKALLLGISGIYAGDSAADYPPMLLYLMAIAAWAANQFPSEWGSAVLTAVLKSPSMLADVVTAGLIARSLRSRSPLIAIGIASAYLFNPAIWYVSTIWGQTDSVYALFLVTAVILSERGAVASSWIAYSLALATKLQSIALAPLMLVVALLTSRPRAWLLSVSGAIGVFVVLMAPWWIDGRLGDVVAMYKAQPNEWLRVDVSAYNLWFLLQGYYAFFPSSLSHPLGLPLSYQLLGTLLFSAYATLIAVLATRRSIPLAAAALSLGLFMFMTQIHERHMFPVLAFLALACARRPRLWIPYIALSATLFWNLVTIAPFTPAFRLELAESQVDFAGFSLTIGLARLAAAINLLALVWLTVDLVKEYRGGERSVLSLSLRDLVPQVLRRRRPASSNGSFDA